MCNSKEIKNWLKFWNKVWLFQIIKDNIRIVDFISSQWDQEVWKRKEI